MSNPDWGGPEPRSQDQQFSTMEQPSYGNQSQYGTYPGPAAPQYGAWQPPPPDYRAWAIAAVVGGVLFSLLIGMPLGLIALRSSRHVRARSESGDREGAERASRSARSLAIASTVFDVLGVLLVIVVLSHSGHPSG